MRTLPKVFEVRDVGTFIPAIAIKLAVSSDAERYLLKCSGYEVNDEGVVPHLVLFGKLNGKSKLCFDVYDQDSSTMQQAHPHVQDNWYSLASGEVIDVEFVRGDSKEPKISERLEQ
jgi:hypothetical protein